MLLPRGTANLGHGQRLLQARDVGEGIAMSDDDSGGIVLGGNRFGKAEVRLVRIDRAEGSVGLPTDLNITSHLSGDLSAVHLEGDNAGVLTTDAQKNTMYAFARDAPIGSTVDFALRLAKHFVETVEGVHRAQIEISAYPWSRLSVAGAPAPHSFQRAGGPTAVTEVTYEAGRAWVVLGLEDLVVMNATGSEFNGFLREDYTTLPETDERILATAVSARWRYADFDVASGAGVDWVKSAAETQRLMLETFAATYSKSLQQTLYSMGRRVLTELPEVMEIRMSMPNKHHFLSDLTPFGRDNPDVVYYAADRPYGLIEGTVVREDAPDPGLAWTTW
jgi:urate oxidase